MSVNERDFVQSIDRAFAVLRAFDARRPNPTLAELAEATELSRPAVRRILLTLRELGYVTDDTGHWSLTPRILTLGEHYSAANALVQAAMPHLVRIAERTAESASLGVLDNGWVIYAARVPVRRIMSINVAVGTRIPAYATSMGRALLAWAPEAVVAEVLDAAPLDRLTARTITDPAALRAELAGVRERGYALTFGELEDGLISLAAPVRDATGAVVGVLASSTSAGRSTPARLRAEVAPILLTHADRLSTELGYRPADS
ncbi:IclR family transcriptional regulator domain-containing protein [Nocardia aurantia]|uniref:Glycerol operon regulatory protein n=1 Tax=Nocardia aurantia TaxID=2585199 RepID=A0A7K0DNG7_9NOCA|nr:IclR family transcriptional regulator C-terminal domain-containing protein [Nocardia aurantia]MQY27280.1 Pca regulon regulatory protein [Nocardia aurantia]